MLRHINDSVKSWQRPGLRRRSVFTLLGVLIALSYALLLAGEEAQAKGGKESPNRGSAGESAEGGSKPVREAAGEVNEPAGNGAAGRKEAGVKEADSVAARDPGPRADRPSPVDDRATREAAGSATTNRIADKAPSAVDLVSETSPPTVERTGSLGEVAGKAREATVLAVEPVLDEAPSVAGSVLEGETRLPRAEPILDEATTRLPEVEPILEGTAEPEIAPVLDKMASETVPVLDGATAPARPVLEETTSTVEPVFEEANTPAAQILEEANVPASPALAETLPAVEPVLNGAIPAAAEPVGEAVEPVARPLGEEATPTAGPVLEEAAFPGVEPAIGAAAPVFEPVSETVAPVVGSGFGEGGVSQSAEPPVFEGNAGAIPASLWALPYHALAVEARGVLPDLLTPATLGSTRRYSSVRDEPPASAAGPPGARSGLFDASFVIEGRHTALLGPVTTKDARERIPHPLPFGFPPAAPPVGISFGSSGAGVALDLLAILALLPFLSRVGGLWWSNRAAFNLGSSLRLAVERPG